MNITWQHRLVQRILRVSSAIHKHKERLAHQEAGINISEGVVIIFLELWLRVLSLPAYLFIRRDAIVATFAEHPDDVVRYRSRSGILNSVVREHSKDTK